MFIPGIISGGFCLFVAYQQVRMNLNELELKRKDVEVLRLVANHGDRGVTTSEIVEVVGWAKKGENHKVTYRFDKLEKRDLISTRQESERGKGNEIDPRVAYPTDEGAELAEGVEFDPSNAPMEERLERLEKKVGAMKGTYGEVKKRIVEIEEELDDLGGEVDDIDDDLDGLAEDVRQIRRDMPAPDLGSELEFGDD